MATKRPTPIKSNGAEDAARERIVVDFGELQKRKFTGREVRDFEGVQSVRYMSLPRVLESGEMPFDTLLALLWILHRRRDPSFTWDNALDLTEDDWEIAGAVVSEADPTATEPVPTTGS